MDCEVTIKIGDKVIKKRMGDRQLDEALYKNRASLYSRYKNLKGLKTFALNSEHQAVVDSITEQAQKNAVYQIFQNSEDDNKTTQIARANKLLNRDSKFAMGVNSVFNMVGSKNKLDDPYNVRLTSDPKMEKRAAFGTHAHAIFESIITGKLVPASEPKHALDAKLNNIAQEVINHIKAEHPDCTILAEIPIISKNVNPKLIMSINGKGDAVGGTFESSPGNGDWHDYLAKDVAYVHGRCDILVIDKSGKVFIYDIKTKNNFNISSNGVVNQSDEMELWSYYSILRQQGLDVQKPRVIAIKTNYDSDQNATDVTLDVSMGNRYGVYNINDSSIARRLARRYFPAGISTENVSTVSSDEIINEMIPIPTRADNTSDIVESMKQRFKETMVSEIKPGEENYGVYKYRIDNINTKITQDGQYKRFFNTEDEVNSYIDSYARETIRYYAEINQELADEIRSLQGENLSEDRIVERLMRVSYNNQQLYRSMMKFIKDPTWQLESNQEMLNSGIFMFKNVNEARSELVIVSNNNLDAQVRFGDNEKTTILGNYLFDNEEEATSDNILEGTYGSREFMRAMAFVDENRDLFRDARLENVCVVGLYTNRLIEQPIDQLVENYITLKRKRAQANNDKSVQLGFGSDIVMPIVEAAINKANDYLFIAGTNNLYQKSKIQMKLDGDYMLEDLYKMLDALRRGKPAINNFDSLDPNDPYVLAINEIGIAIQALRGFYIVDESNVVGGLATGKVPLQGMQASPADESMSRAGRYAGIMARGFWDIVTSESIKYAKKFQKLLEEAYNEGGVGMFGTPFKYFEEFLEHTSDGSIDPKLKLRKITDPFFNNKPAAKALMEYVYKLFDTMIYEEDDREIALAKSNGSYWDLPLIKARTNKEQWVHGNFIQNILNFWKRAKTFANDAVVGRDPSVNERFIENPDSDSIRNAFHNKHNYNEQAERERTIQSLGVGYFTTDLEYIVYELLSNGIQHQDPGRWLSLSAATRLTIFLKNRRGGANMASIEEGVKLLNAKHIFGNDIIKPEYQSFKKIVGILTGITSYTNLAFRGAALVRETITGIKSGFERLIMEDPLIKDKFTSGDYISALEMIMGQMSFDENKTEIVQFCRKFGMANFGSSEFTERMRLRKLGPLQAGSDVAFFTATWPDFVHRTALLIAYLKNQGCMDSYSLDEDGYLVYDMKKDSRYSVLNKYLSRFVESNRDPNIIPESDRKEFINQLSKYETALNNWNVRGFHKGDGSTYKFGDELPEAIDPTESDSLKVVADKLYGNYDDQTKSLLQSQLLGRVFFQYKTYLLQRYSQWVKPNGLINDITWTDVRDEDGNRYVFVFNDDDSIYQTTEDQIDPEWLLTGKAVIQKVPSKRYIGGNLQATMATIGAIFSLKGQEEFNRKWENPQFRAQTKLALWDCFGMMLLQFILRMLYGEDKTSDMTNQEWYTRWTYAVLHGVTQDGPIWSVASQLYGGGQAPLIGTIQNYFRNATSVITGRKSFMNGFMSSFGATREFSNIFDD